MNWLRSIAKLTFTQQKERFAIYSNCATDFNAFVFYILGILKTVFKNGFINMHKSDRKSPN